MTGARRLVVTSPLESHLVERIRRVDAQVEVGYPVELLASPRYPSDHPFAQLDGDGARERWEALLDEAEILFDFGPLELAPTLATRERLRWIQGTSAGVGRFVERIGLLDSDVIVTTASGVHARPLAEFVVLAMLMFGKNTLHLTRQQREHRWERHADEEVRGKLVCVVGLGKIGREVARLVQAFDARVVGVVRDPGARAADELGVERLVATADVDELLPEADVVVLATPHTPQTHRLIDARRLGLMKSSAILVNVARGDVVDEAALVDALRAGRLGGAALDVFEREPLPPDSPLWDLPNVFVSPHSASTVAAENERTVELFCRNLRAYLDGAPMVNVLDKTLLY
jgi:glyoxylate/hydroxypyruvate reductase A